MMNLNLNKYRAIMTIRKTSFGKNQDGASLIEFALLAPVLFLLLMGIVEIALFMYATHVLENATTASSRYGMTGSAYSADKCKAGNREEFIRCSVDMLSHGLLDVSKLNIQTQDVPDYDSIDLKHIYDDPTEGPVTKPSYGIGNRVIIYHVTYNWKFFTPLIGKLLSDRKDGVYVITANAVIKNEDFGNDANPKQP